MWAAATGTLQHWWTSVLWSSIWLVRLGGSAPPVLPCALPEATVPETTDICRDCVRLRTQWCGWLGSWRLWRAARHVLVEVLIQGWRDHWQPETSTEEHDGCFMATKEKRFTSFLQLLHWQIRHKCLFYALNIWAPKPMSYSCYISNIFLFPFKKSQQGP